MRRVFVRLIAIALALACVACSEVLYTGLSEAEINRMRAALMQHGIEANKVNIGKERWSLEVPREAAGPALQVLEAAGLPAHKYGNTIDSMRSDALVPSAGEDRARLAHGLSQELAQTIGSIDGVVHARVHLSIPEKATPGQRTTHPPSASVFVRHRPGHNLAAMNVAIKLLVARSVEGMSPERVSVIAAALDPVARSASVDRVPTVSPPGVAPGAVAAIGLLCALGGGVAALGGRAAIHRRRTVHASSGAARSTDEDRLAAAFRE